MFFTSLPPLTNKQVRWRNRQNLETRQQKMQNALDAIIYIWNGWRDKAKSHLLRHFSGFVSECFFGRKVNCTVARSEYRFLRTANRWRLKMINICSNRHSPAIMSGVPVFRKSTASLLTFCIIGLIRFEIFIICTYEIERHAIDSAKKVKLQKILEQWYSWPFVTRTTHIA